MSGPGGGDEKRRRLVMPGNGGGRIQPGGPIAVQVDREFALRFSALFQASMAELLPSVQERMLELIRLELATAIAQLQTEVDELRGLAAARPDQLEAVNAWREQDEANGLTQYLPEDHSPELEP